MNHATPERALVGDIIDRPSSIPAVRRTVPSGAYFVDQKLGRIYDLVLAVFDGHGSVDAALLNERCLAAGIDPMEWLACTEHSSPSLAESHAWTVATQWSVRTAVPALRGIADRLALAEVDVPAAIADAGEQLSVIRKMYSMAGVKDGREVALELMGDLDPIFAGAESPAVPFMLADVDQVTGGMFGGNLIVVAAKEKAGKSTFALQCAYGNAESRKVPVLIFSMEMRAKEILQRKACHDCDLRVIDVWRNRITSEQKQALVRRIGELSRLPIYIRDKSATLADIQTEAVRYVSEKGVRFIVVDYIQLVVPVSKRSNENREREVAAVSSGLKHLANELDVPVMALSQLNEDFRTRESKAIEQDMDKMILIGQRPELRDGHTGVIVPIQIRQRMGLSTDMGDVTLYYDMRHGTWASAYQGGAGAVRVPKHPPRSHPVSSDRSEEEGE